MSAVRWATVALAAIEAGYMLLDGARALVVGDYFTPRSGTHAGQLGPWAAVVELVGGAPRSTAMKWVFVLYGAAWLAIAVAHLRGAPWAWWAMLAAAIGSLWYLVPGTAISVAVIVLLAVAGRPHG